MKEIYLSDLKESKETQVTPAGSYGESWMNKVEAMAREIAEREGCRLYDLEFTSGPSGRILRVYIDHAERNVGIEDCSNVSKGMNLLLDVEDVIPGATYSLEVSSPGLERNLKRPWHYQTVLGKAAKFRIQPTLGELGLNLPHLKSTKSFKATIQATDDAGVELLIESEVLKIKHDQIEKAQVVFEFGSEGKPKGKPSKGSGK